PQKSQFTTVAEGSVPGCLDAVFGQGVQGVPSADRKKAKWRCGLVRGSLGSARVHFQLKCFGLNCFLGSFGNFTFGGIAPDEMNTGTACEYLPKAFPGLARVLPGFLDILWFLFCITCWVRLEKIEFAGPMS